MMTAVYAKKHVSRASTVFQKAADLEKMVIKNFGKESYYCQKVRSVVSASYDCMLAMEDMLEHVRQSNPRAAQRVKRKL
jgi:hypothetical protein